MPNWCSNTLTLADNNEPNNNDILNIASTQVKIKEPIDKVLENYLTTNEDGQLSLDFEKILPIPEGYKDDDRWYDWCVSNWGTKWNADTYNISDEGISLGTAWSPPLPVISELAKLVQKDLRLIYIEEGMGFCGEFIANSDGTFVDNCYDIPKAPEELLNELGYEEWEDLSE